MLKWTLAAVAAVIVVFLIVVALQPPAFAQVNDFQNCPKAGTGAVYAWQGNREVGEGRMTITESRPGELVRIRLEFFKPMAAVNTTEFRFRPAGEETAITWNQMKTAVERSS